MKRKYRMYGLVPYNLSPIQQGIQFGHAVVEYGLDYGHTPEYQKWADKDKTFIILNGGTTNDKISTETGLPFGTLNNHELILANELDIPTSRFTEPDLGDQLTAIVFLVDEYVWDTETYPEPEENEAHPIWMDDFSIIQLQFIFKLRDFLKGFRLA